MGTHAGMKPRSEVLKGDLEDAIFAADFGDLIAGITPRCIVRRRSSRIRIRSWSCVIRFVLERLAQSKKLGVTIRLSAGSGGGKTRRPGMTRFHTLGAFITV
jgi:hypothetical protein